MRGLSGAEHHDRHRYQGGGLMNRLPNGLRVMTIKVRTIKGGGEDFLYNPVSSHVLLQAIERAIAHHEVTRGLKSKLDVVRVHIAALTPREREVFALIVRGNTNKHIARALGATERTIKAHRHRVMEKMQVQSLAELVSLADTVGDLDGT